MPRTAGVLPPLPLQHSYSLVVGLGLFIDWQAVSYFLWPLLQENRLLYTLYHCQCIFSNLLNLSTKYDYSVGRGARTHITHRVLLGRGRRAARRTNILALCCCIFFGLDMAGRARTATLPHIFPGLGGRDFGRDMLSPPAV